MKLALLAALLLLPAQQETSVFTEPYAGLQFTHPATWKVTKKEKDRTFLAIPVQGSTESAELVVIRDTFHADKDLFQTIQLRINEQLKREVVRQWEQEILGVPMLFTRINYTQDGIAKSTLTGLLNTRTPLKMLLRLTARQADYDNVAYELNQALETLRTVDGKPALPDDPSIKLEAPPKKPTPPPLPPKLIDDGSKTPNVVKPTQSQEITVSTRKVNLLYPEGWTVVETSGTKVVLKHPDLLAPVVLEIFSTLDSDSPQKAVFKASSKTLNEYLQVSSREDKAGAPNKAGAGITSVWRTGKTQEGEMATYEGAGLVSPFYFLLTYKQTDMAAYRNERKLIDSLVDLLTIEPAP
jgi:hypothetical protein